MPARCRFPAASVMPSRRTPSMLATSSCVMTSSFDGQAIEGQQQPAAQLLLHRMVPVAGRGLGHLRDQRLGVAQQQALHQAGAIEFLLQQARSQPVTVARGLHHGRAGRGIAAHEQRNADDAFVAHARGFGRCAGLHDIVQRHDGGGGEIGVLQLSAGFVEHFAEQHRDQFQMRQPGARIPPRAGRRADGFDSGYGVMTWRAVAVLLSISWR